MVDAFKMYTDEESTELKHYFINALTNMSSIVKRFMEKYIKHPKLHPEIQKLIYEHQIYFSKHKLQTFYQLVKKSGDVDIKALEAKRETSEMYQKRSKEYSKIKNFVNVNYLRMLSDKEDSSINTGNQHKDEDKITSDNDSKPKAQFIKENATLNKNIIFSPIESDIMDINKNINTKITKENDDNDDIQIEPLFTGKKRNRDKDKGKGINHPLSSNLNNKKQSVIFKHCYICKAKFNEENNHSFYSNLCKACGDYNYSFRVMKLDFNGRIAVVTGGRVKIGYYIATKLLEYGCKVILTSRFPKDCLLKYQAHPQYSDWKANLLIYPIDFRLFESTVKFITFLNENFPHIDILINNAAQTIRRSTSYYKYLLPVETKAFNSEDERKIIKNDYINLSRQLEGSTHNSTEAKEALVSISQTIEDKAILPLSVIASQIRIMEEKEQPNKTLISQQDHQPIDFSKGKSSWNLELDEVPFQEFTEVQIINTWTPYYLCVKLNPLMKKSPFNDKYIVNVSSVEGLFNHFKRTTHPHTNMAKAALNMLTRTCGQYYKSFGIYMTSVDTGWVSPMNEFNSLFEPSKTESFEKEYCNIPLDELDGAMRVLHPIIEGIKNKKYIYGQILKDYAKSNW